MICQDPGPSHGAYALGKAQVFHRYRHPMQGTAVGPGTDVSLCHPGRLQSLLSHHSRIAFVTPVELADAIEEGSRHFHGRELLRLYQGGEFSDGMEIQRCIWHGSVLSVSVFSISVPYLESGIAACVRCHFSSSSGCRAVTVSTVGARAAS